ncbi:helix-turn-helix transcriptional regulator [Streptomyces sp. S.PB5]|uniref:helix-turn-helix domain-containing protein n=1 Tax=Streptomyces sp. S.PB5 TaxID=3020844 RepID=UPI0025B277EA|nr:helix-turn-helix transcriptional regulator [Streptomyces sp. S.PB5]MDN3026866.1 helix-turn-helix transcriptional regulator [Streptomyces sp. S.PB5]
MTDFEAIDALLAGARQEVALPSADLRRELREGLNLSRTQVARVLGVSPSTVGGWESGRDPGGEVREKYAYFLEGARTKLAEQAAEEAPEPVEPGEPGLADGSADSDSGSGSGSDSGRGPGSESDEVEALPAPQPCVLCGAPARHQVAGFPQHLDPADCGTATPEPAAPVQPVPVQPEPVQPAPVQPPPVESRTAAARAPRDRAAEPVRVVPVGRRMQTAGQDPDLIGAAVAAALDKHGGDLEEATAALVKRAIPDAMALLDETRKGGRYDVVAHPWIPDILRKQTARGADRIWEARPKWARTELPPGAHEVTALDINGAYLSALKTHLPIGQLEHSTGFEHDRRRAGVHLITPPAWEHEAHLPNPIGNRDEPGPLWVTEPTLRLLLRLSGPRYGLCEPPVIHESFTSGATENLLEKFRVALKDARDRAIAEGDDVTLEYVKAMYSKFVSTMGESNYNRELYRPDWMHLIRSQAFANLWTKAYKAHEEGLTVVRAMGTDELHVIGDWRRVFPEGRGVAEVKVKDTYTVGEDFDPGAAGEGDD